MAVDAYKEDSALVRYIIFFALGYSPTSPPAKYLGLNEDSEIS